MVWSEWRRCIVDNVRERGLYKLLNDCTLVSESRLVVILFRKKKICHTYL